MSLKMSRDFDLLDHIGGAWIVVTEDRLSGPSHVGGAFGIFETMDAATHWAVNQDWLDDDDDDEVDDAWSIMQIEDAALGGRGHHSGSLRNGSSLPKRTVLSGFSKPCTTLMIGPRTKNCYGKAVMIGR